MEFAGLLERSLIYVTILWKPYYLLHSVEMTLINLPPSDLVLRFGLMEKRGVAIVNDGGGGRTG